MIALSLVYMVGIFILTVIVAKRFKKRQRRTSELENGAMMFSDRRAPSSVPYGLTNLGGSDMSSEADLRNLDNIYDKIPDQYVQRLSADPSCSHLQHRERLYSTSSVDNADRMIKMLFSDRISEDNEVFEESEKKISTASKPKILYGKLKRKLSSIDFSSQIESSTPGVVIESVPEDPKKSIPSRKRLPPVERRKGSIIRDLKLSKMNRSLSGSNLECHNSRPQPPQRRRVAVSFSNSGMDSPVVLSKFKQCTSFDSSEA